MKSITQGRAVMQYAAMAALLSGLACGGGEKDQPPLSQEVGAAGQSASDPQAAASQEAPPSNDGTGGTLQLTSRTPEDVAGVYRRDGVGLSFSSTKKGDKVELRLGTLDGRELLRVENGDTELRMVIAGEYVETVKKEDLKAAKESGDASSLADLTPAQIQARDAALAKMESMPEYVVMPWLSRALGQQGLNGADFPATYAIHMLGATIAKEKGISIPVLPQPEESADGLSRPETAGDGKDVATAQQAMSWSNCDNGTYCPLGNCPAPPDSFGECGPPGECWPWICKDCCAHAGCPLWRALIDQPLPLPTTFAFLIPVVGPVLAPISTASTFTDLAMELVAHNTLDAQEQVFFRRLKNRWLFDISGRCVPIFPQQTSEVAGIAAETAVDVVGEVVEGAKEVADEVGEGAKEVADEVGEGAREIVDVLFR